MIRPSRNESQAGRDAGTVKWALTRRYVSRLEHGNGTHQATNSLPSGYLTASTARVPRREPVPDDASRVLLLTALFADDGLGDVVRTGLRAVSLLDAVREDEKQQRGFLPLHVHLRKGRCAESPGSRAVRSSLLRPVTTGRARGVRTGRCHHASTRPSTPSAPVRTSRAQVRPLPCSVAEREIPAKRVRVARAALDRRGTRNSCPVASLSY